MSKVTFEQIEKKIVDKTFTVLYDGRTTLCQLTLENGYTVLGTSACVDKSNYDQQIGEDLAYKDAVRNVWPLEGYLLAERVKRGAELLIHSPSMVERLARSAHEMNRVYCEALGDYSHTSWDKAPEWQRESAREGVRALVRADLTPAQTHENWVAYKQNEGWRYGPVKDAEKKEHPCMVPYDQLPQEQKVKDHLFRAVVQNIICPI